MRISDWSSDVCSSDLPPEQHRLAAVAVEPFVRPVDVARRQGQPAAVAAGPGLQPLSSEARRVGNGCVSTRRSRWSPSHYKKKYNPRTAHHTPNTHTRLTLKISSLNNTNHISHN